MPVRYVYCSQRIAFVESKLGYIRYYIIYPHFRYSSKQISTQVNALFNSVLFFKTQIGRHWELNPSYLDSAILAARLILLGYSATLLNLKMFT